MAADLSQVLWIGGPAGAGKTTVARLLARRHGLRWYSVDAHSWDHRERAVAAGLPVPEYGPGDYDRGPMIVADMCALPGNALVVAEGTFLEPRFVRPLDQAVWLLPSQAEQRRRLEVRHPEDVHHGFLYSWRLVAGWLAGTGATTITVDGQTVEETVAEVEEHFAARIGAGPTARTLTERRELLRYANQITVAHCLTSFARPDFEADPATAVRSFECECADPRCTETTELTVAEAAARLARQPPAITAAGNQAGHHGCKAFEP